MTSKQQVAAVLTACPTMHESADYKGTLVTFGPTVKTPGTKCLRNALLSIGQKQRA